MSNLHPAARFDQALACYEAGRLDQAFAICRDVTSRTPSHSGAWHLLGTLACARADYAYGLDCIERAIRYDPGHPVIHFNRGNALTGLERYDEAIAAYRRALDINPADLRPLHNLAVALKAVGNFEEAEATLRRAAMLEPANVEAQLNLARFLAGQDGERDDEAEAAFKQVLALSPENVKAHAYLAAFYEHRARLDDAAAIVRAGLVLQPDYPDLHLTAAKLCQRDGRREDAIRHLDALRDSCVPSELEKDIVFASEMGQLEDQAGNSAAAFAQFSFANAATARTWQVTAAERVAIPQRLEQLHDAFTPAWTAEWSPTPPDAPEAADSPVFLQGFARSGTTLLATVLDAHPAFQAVEEKPASVALIKAIKALPGGEPQGLAQLDGDQLRSLRKAYLDAIDKHVRRRTGALLLDKNPFNTINAGPLYRVFPNARFILAVRHPCDVVLSCFMQSFKKNTATVHFLNLTDAARLYAQVMNLWGRYVAALPLNYHRIRYEDLVENPEAELHRLLDSLGIGWSDAVLDHVAHAKSRGKVLTPGYQKISRPIYREARYRWLKYRDQMAPVLDILRPFIEDFGYSSS